jgi:hypothetical protein
MSRDCDATATWSTKLGSGNGDGVSDDAGCGMIRGEAT